MDEIELTEAESDMRKGLIDFFLLFIFNFIIIIGVKSENRLIIAFDFRLKLLIRNCYQHEMSLVWNLSQSALIQELNLKIIGFH